jgi:UDP-GlcNAc:undecaprenyl-phosphate GlcNAc-1-phosphate transferase
MLSLPITVLWMVGITNAFNLIDGIDGLAAGAALFATLALLVVSIATGQLAVAAALAAVAGASAGFLRYNFNPASIFLGDSGSLFLGFILSVLSIESSQKSAVAFAVAVPIVSLGLPVLDTAVVITRRLIRRQPLFRGDRRHIHHMLLDRGMPPREVVIWLYAVCGLLGVLSMLVASPSGRTVGPVLVMLGIAVGIGIQQLKIPELRALNAHVIRGLQRQRGLLAGGALVQSLLDDLAAASDGAQVLCVLSKSLEEAGFVGARLIVPKALKPGTLRSPDWTEGPVTADEYATQLLEWRSQARGSESNVITLVIPLKEITTFGELTLVANSDDRHHAAIISWLANDVGRVVGTNLARVCGGSTRELPDAHPLSAEC